MDNSKSHDKKSRRWSRQDSLKRIEGQRNNEGSWLSNIRNTRNSTHSQSPPISPIPTNRARSIGRVDSGRMIRHLPPATADIMEVDDQSLRSIRSSHSSSGEEEDQRVPRATVSRTVNLVKTPTSSSQLEVSVLCTEREKPVHHEVRKLPPRTPSYEKCAGYGCYSRDSKTISKETQRYERYIEIVPGHSTRLRGAQETWQCIEQDFFMPVTCLACGLDLCCIQDADYVLCPICKVISPMDNIEESIGIGGVGLGFTLDDLARWQSEIIKSRREC